MYTCIPSDQIIVFFVILQRETRKLHIHEFMRAVVAVLQHSVVSGAQCVCGAGGLDVRPHHKSGAATSVSEYNVLLDQGRGEPPCIKEAAAASQIS